MASVSVQEKSGFLVLKNRFCEICVDLNTGSWSGRDRTTDMLVFRDASLRVDRAGTSPWPEVKRALSWRQSKATSALGAGTTVTLTATPEAGYEPITMLTLRLFSSQPFVEIGWGISNPFAYPVRVRDVEVLYGGELFVGQKVTAAQTLRSGSGADANIVEKGWQIEALNGALLTYKDHNVRRSLVAGGLAYTEFARRVELLKGQKQTHKNIRRGDLKNLNIACWDPQGKHVQPGETFMSPDTCYLDFVTADPFDALEAYGRAMRLANDAKPNAYDFPTLCGWMVSTQWLGEGKPINNSVGLVEQTEIAAEQGLMKYTPLAVRLEPDTYCHGNYGNTQQGWWDDEHWRGYAPGGGHKMGEQEGSLRKPYDTFKKFCKAVADRGGIPFTYFQSSMPSNDFAVAHPDWMLGGDISELHKPHAHHRPFVRYDYTHPGFRAHCLKVWKRLQRAGLKGVKFDYPETAWARYGGFNDDSFTTTAAYRELFRLCREGLGHDAFLHERNLGGETHESAPCLDVTAGIVDIQRVWGDASHFEAEMASRMGLRWYKSRSVFLYYPDGKSFINNGRPLPAYKRQAFLTVIGFLSGRLEIGTSIGSMTDEMFHDTTRLFPVLAGTVSPRPVDMLSGSKHPATYTYTVSDDWMQVLMINNNKSGRKTVSAPLSGDQADTGSLGLHAKQRYHAFDFWNQRYLGSLRGSSDLSADLRAGEVAMVSVRKVASHPQVISTNRHIMQGMMECHGLRWSETKHTLSGKVDVIGGEDFVLTIACNGRKPVSCDGASIRKRGHGLIDLVFVSADNARRPFRFRF